MTIEQRLAEIIQAFCADALSCTVTLNRRAYSPVLRQSDLRTDITIPSW